MLGIEKYELNYLDDIEEVKKQYGQTFNDLIGQPIDEYFVQWNLDEKNWNEDGPIILSIGGNQYEFTAYQLQYSLTINKIRLTDKLDWYGARNEMPLIWKRDIFENINSALHNPITKIYALEYGLGASFHLVGFEFEIEGLKDCLHISNGLDCNNIKLHNTETDVNNKRFQIV